MRWLPKQRQDDRTGAHVTCLPKLWSQYCIYSMEGVKSGEVNYKVEWVSLNTFTSFPNSLWGGIWGRFMTTAVKDILQDQMGVGVQSGGKGIELMANFWYRFCFKTLITSSSVSSSSVSPTSVCLWLIFNLVIEKFLNRTCRNVKCPLHYRWNFKWFRVNSYSNYSLLQLQSFSYQFNYCSNY